MQPYSYFEQEDQIYDQQDNKSLENSGFNAQMGFVKKVYSILSFQLAFTSLACILAVVSPAYVKFQIANPWLLYLFLGIQFVVTIILTCVQGVARTVPTNYILLAIFTVLESYIVSFFCGIYPPTIVLQAAILTTAMFLALTVYAWTTKTDFTMMGGLLFVCTIVMIIAGFILIFFQSQIVHLIYCCLGVILFSIYVIYDTQLMLGKGAVSYEIDDYILAALNLYIDIIQLFLYILQILGSD